MCWDQQRVSEIVRETLDDVLTPIIYAEALELIDEHKRAGRKTVIISSSPPSFVTVRIYPGCTRTGVRLRWGPW